MLGVGYTVRPRQAGERARPLTDDVIDRAIRSLAYQISGMPAAQADERVAAESHVEPGTVWRERERVRKRLNG